MQTNECFMCGGNDFTVTDGAYICTECGIQSQTIREEQINFNDNIITVNHDDMVDKDHEITAGSQLEKTKKLLSWECFNLILLGLTNEIIKLGAKPNLKVIVLQLWVHYLQSIEAAFTSKKFKKLPKLNSAINDVDCEILYGVKNVKSKLLIAKTKRKTNKNRTNKNISSSSYSSASSVLTESQKRQRITRKLQKLDNSSRNTDLNCDSTELSSDVSLLQRRKKSRKIKIKLTKTTKKSLSTMTSMKKILTNEESSSFHKTGKKCWNNFKFADMKNYTGIKKLVAIIHLALMINDDDIYLSDILRWAYEGHFHVNRVNLFLPENVLHGINLNLMNFTSRYELKQETAMVLKKCFKTNQLPKIDYNKLVLRFCDELQLPTDFTHFVCKLISLSAPSLQFTSQLPDIEVKIMAYVLFAAKFLFCLDDNAENISSDFAEKVNQSNKIEKQLFSWNNYVQYIECRNSVTSNYIYSQHKNVYQNKIHNTELFINDWNIMMPTLPIKRSVSKGFRDDTECLLKFLPNDKKKKSYREIPASTKPLSSTLQWILEYFPMELSSEAKKILKNNFVHTDILYLTNATIINNLADQCNIPIKVSGDQPLHYVKEKAEKIKCFTKTKVYLSNQSKPIIKNILNETVNDLCEEEKSSTIFLGTGFNYWYIDLCETFLKENSASKTNSILKNRLPHSFQWFMNQCCIFLSCSQSDLYCELMVLEKKMMSFLQTDLTELKDTVSDLNS